MSTALCAALSILSAPAPACSLLGEEDWLPATTATAAAPNMATNSSKPIRFRFLAFCMVIAILRNERLFSHPSRPMPLHTLPVSKPLQLFNLVNSWPIVPR